MGIAVLFDFFFQFIYSTARGIQTYFESIFTRYVVDIVCIYSCFSLGQVQYTVPDAYVGTEKNNFCCKFQYRFQIEKTFANYESISLC